MTETEQIVKLADDEVPELSRQLMFGPARPPAWRPLILFGGLGALLLLAVGFSVSSVARPILYIILGTTSCLILAALLAIPVSTVLALYLAKKEKPQAGLKLLNIATLWAGTVSPFIVPRVQILLGMGLGGAALEYLNAKWKSIPEKLRDHASAIRATCWVQEETNLFEAINEFAELRKRHPDWRDLALTHGMAYFLLGNYEEAVVHLEDGSDVIETVPRIRRESIYFALGESHREAGDPMHAAKWFKLSRQAIEARRAKSR